MTGEEGRSFELSDESAGEEDGNGDQLSALRRESSVTFPRGFSSKEDLEIGTPKLGGMMSSGGGGFGDAEDERKGNRARRQGSVKSFVVIYKDLPGCVHFVKDCGFPFSSRSGYRKSVFECVVIFFQLPRNLIRRSSRRVGRNLLLQSEVHLPHVRLRRQLKH